MNKLNLALYTLSLSFLASCTITTPVQFAKPVGISENDVREIKNIVLLNRTAVPKDSKTGNVLEGILTGEMVGADKRGAEVCVQGIRQGLSESLNYKTIQQINIPFYGAKNGGFPDPLPWKMVDSLCKQYNTDALIALEYFDSDGGVSLGLTNPNVPVNYGTRTNNVSVKTFWRYYDAKKQAVIDNYDFKTLSGNGGYKSPNIPYNVSRKYEATKDAGFWAGMEYAYRVSEQVISEGRVCYRGGNPNMRRAARLASVGDWQSAANIWSEEAERSSKRKIRARALNNLALYNERLGNLEAAVELATRAVGERYYSSTGALINRLKVRINDRQRLLDNYDIKN